MGLDIIVQRWRRKNDEESVTNAWLVVHTNVNDQSVALSKT